MFENYSGATRIIPILGHPVAQTKSPFGMTRAFGERGIDAVVVPFDVSPEAIGGFLTALDAAANLGGVIATVPHKFSLCAHAAVLTERARFFGSANVMRRMADGAWQADMLDGLGFMRAIRRAGGTIAGANALLVGAGGAGSAIALELLNEGAASVAVHDTDEARRARLMSRLDAAHPGRARVGSAEPTGFDLVINATPLGMREGDMLPLRVAALDRGMFVGDVVTARGDTALIAAAKAAGCAWCSGHDMFETSIDLMVEFFTAGGALPRRARDS
jgi:shikimate dehydrogenase